MRSLTLVILLLATASAGQLSAGESQTAQASTLNAKDTGYHGIRADGHGRKPSSSSLYFCDKQRTVRVLPREMTGDVGNAIVRIAIPKLRLRLPPTEELVKPERLEYNSND